MIKDYELTLEDYMFILEYKNSERTIFPINHTNEAWIELGKKYSFDPYTVERVQGSYYKFKAKSVE